MCNIPKYLLFSANFFSFKLFLFLFLFLALHDNFISWSCNDKNPSKDSKGIMPVYITIMKLKDTIVLLQCKIVM